MFTRQRLNKEKAVWLYEATNEVCFTEGQSARRAAAWAPYTDEARCVLEAAYQAGAESARAGAYVVSFADMRQRREDAPEKVRRVRRECGAGGVGGAADDDEDDEDTESNTEDGGAAAAKAAAATKPGAVPPSALSPPVPPSALSPKKKKKAGEGSPAKRVRLSVVPPPAPLNVAALLEKVPPIADLRLGQAAVRMRGPVCLFLKTLGREPTESGARSCAITIRPELVDAAREEYNVQSFKITRQSMERLQATAEITMLEGRVAGDAPYVTKDDGVKLSRQQEFQAKYVCVSGYVSSVFGNDYRSVPNTGARFLAVSIPGVNFRYSKADIEALTENGAVREDKARATMQDIWRHALSVMHLRGVEVPVLCAIGCGAFRGSHSQVPRLWAEALAAALHASPAFAFRAVVVSVPTFGADNNHDPFSSVFGTPENAGLRVTLTKDHSMVAVAALLAERGIPAAILNPSDPEAVRCGKMGMYWDGGHIALEEILALQTTLLLQVCDA